MPGIYTVEMLAMKYGENTHEVRRALMDAGVAINLNDQVDVDAAEKADAGIKKWLGDLHEERKGEKLNPDKAARLAEHNTAVEKALADAGGWDALVAKGGKVSSSKKEE